ncbi:MAG: hypothetical protein OEZ06_08365 [Myxococcales bacterium]|nr:hypothetical protein [Myxococcales bacterium]
MTFGRAAALLIVAAISAQPRAARAFTEPRSYFDDANNGGGGGRWFTGSPAEGYGCDVCHGDKEPLTLRIEGVPENGYVPGQRYELNIAWPDFARRAAEIRQQGEEPSSMGLVLELVAETGMASGSLEVAPAADAEDGELCVLPEGAQATKLFRVRPGEATTEEAVRCDANALGQRCLAAVLSCGAEETRISWTAPPTWQGAIWLSAGFVATEKVSGDPHSDAVTMISRPLLPAASAAEHYETRLRGSCAVSAIASRHGAPGRTPIWMLGALALWTARRRWRHR